MDPDFVRSIEHPDELQLQQLQESAWETVLEVLEGYDIRDIPDWVVRKMTYTYYHDWETDEPEYVFLLEDPGSPGAHVVLESEEYASLGEGCDPLDAIQVDRRFGARWLGTRRYTDFTSEFIEICESAGLISTSRPWWRYLLSGRFFGDFYMTDVIKYRGVNAGTGDINTAFSSHLIHELEYVDPEMIFAFGKRAWETIREQLGAVPMGEAPAGTGVSDVHGVPHATERILDTAVLPVGHPSTNFRGAQISHEEYMSRFARGIRQLVE
jgi:hypothetical protein